MIRLVLIALLVLPSAGCMNARDRAEVAEAIAKGVAAGSAFGPHGATAGGLLGGALALAGIVVRDMRRKRRDDATGAGTESGPQTAIARREIP